MDVLNHGGCRNTCRWHSTKPPSGWHSARPSSGWHLNTPDPFREESKSHASRQARKNPALEAQSSQAFLQIFPKDQVLTLLQTCQTLDPYFQLSRMRKLLQQGACPNCLDPQTFSEAQKRRLVCVLQLHSAFSCYDLFEPHLVRDIVQLASPWPQTTKPLHAAAAAGRNSAVRMLLKYKADLEARDEEGLTPLIHAHKYSCYHTPALTKTLLGNAADVNARCSKGNTPLMWAVGQKNYNSTKLLLEAQAHPNVYHDGKDPLFSASFQGSADLVQLLLRAHASLNSVTALGNTALIIAVFNGHTEPVRCILEEVKRQKRCSRTLGREAHPETQMWHAALKLPTTMSPLLPFSGSETWKAQTHRLKDATEWIDHQNVHGDTALIYASQRRHTEIVQLLLEAKANSSLSNKRQRTALNINKFPSSTITELILAQTR